MSPLLPWSHLVCFEEAASQCTDGEQGRDGDGQRARQWSAGEQQVLKLSRLLDHIPFACVLNASSARARALGCWRVVAALPRCPAVRPFPVSLGPGTLSSRPLGTPGPSPSRTARIPTSSQFTFSKSVFKSCGLSPGCGSYGSFPSHPGLLNGRACAKKHTGSGTRCGVKALPDPPCARGPVS